MASSNGSAEALRPLTILAVHRPPAPILRDIDMVVPGGVTDLTFRYVQGPLTDHDVDVIHVQESKLDVLLGTQGASGGERLAASWGFARFLRKHGIALVRSIDEPTSTPKERLSRVARSIIDRATHTFVAGDASVSTPDAARTRVIPHAHFRDRFMGYPGSEMVAGRVLCIARGNLPASAAGIANYPGLTDVAGISVRIVGDAPGAVRTRITDACARYRSTLSARIERLSDGARVQEIDAAELVVVPRRATSSHDLQIIFVALSRNRPVVTERTNALESLARRAGAGWLFLTEGPVTAASLDDALLASRAALRSAQPDLGGFGLAESQQAYEETFRAAAANR